MDRKYIFLAGAVLGLIILTLILISSYKKKTPETIELNFVTYNEDENNLKEIFSNFEAVNNAKINFVKIDAKSYELESLNRLATGKIDVWGIPNNWIPKQKDKLSGNADYIDYFRSIYPEIVQSENIFDNQIYGLPLAADPLVLFVNNELKGNTKNLNDDERDLLSKVATNWDDFGTQARLLTTKSGNAITSSGAALGAQNFARAPDVLTLLMLQNGTQMTNETKTQATFHTAVNTLGGQDYPGTAALDYYTSFAKTNSQNYSFSESLGDPLTAFSEGRIAYYIDNASREKEIKKLNKDLDYTIADIPQVKNSDKPISYISYETFTVPNTSKHQSLAWQLLTELTAKENYNKYYSVSKKAPIFLEELDNSDIAGKAVLSAKNWYNPDPPKVAEVFRASISQVLSGKSAQTAIDGVALQVTALLEKIKE